MARKQVKQVTLVNGEKIITSIDRGEAAEKAMIAGQGVWVSDTGRHVKASMIGDVHDEWVEDIQMQLGEQLREAKRIPAKGNVVKATATSPGYIKFLLADRKMRRKHGLPFRPLTEEQLIIIDEIEEREAYNKAQDENYDSGSNTSTEEQQVSRS